MPTEEQEQAIHSLKKHVIVTASAGAGKTTTMVSRVIGLITERRVPLSSVVMLTFTEAAAEEMKTRLAAALIEEIKSAVGDKKKELVKALDSFPFLSCCTIDSFCYKLVKAHFELLGLSPLHSIAGDQEKEMHRSRAMKRVLDEYGEENREAIFELAASFGKEEEKSLAKAIMSLYDFAETTEDGDAFLLGAEELLSGDFEDIFYVKDHVRKMAGKAASLLEELRQNELTFPSDARILKNRYRQISDALESFARCESVRDLYLARAALPRLGSLGNDAEKFPEFTAQYRLVADRFSAFKENFVTMKNGLDGYAAMRESVADTVKETKELIALTKRFKVAYREEKERDRRMDFSDVEHYALTLLEKHGVAEEIGCKYLLVDECQDLNPLQDALMRRIVGEENLFTVGDVKQSIYRFRLSDPELFQSRVEKGMRDASDADVIEFSENFRSSDAVIAFVNKIFTHLMDEDFGGIRYLPANRGNRTAGSGEVRCFFYSEPKRVPTFDKVYSVKSAAEERERSDRMCTEGAWIRDRILEIVHTTFRDTKHDEEFTLSYKDIAILSSSRMASGNLQEKVVDCLREAGIPVNLGDFVREAEYPEIYALVDLLRLIESPRNDVALLSVLRSDLFGFSPEELAAISEGEGESFSDKAEKAAEKGGKIAEFYAYLNKIRFLSDTVPFCELVSRIIDERYRHSVLNRPDGRKVFGELTAFADSLKQTKAASSLSEYLAYFDGYFKMDGAGEVEARDAVSLMTVHASKGRQFPVVFVMGLGESIVGNRLGSDPVRADKQYGAIKKPNTANLLGDLFSAKKVKEQKEDKLRLLYVALTRAQNSLYLCGKLEPDSFVSKEKAATVTQWVAEAMGGAYDYETEYHPIERGSKTLSQLQGEANPNDVTLLKNSFNYDYPHQTATKTGIKYTVTAINAMEEQGYAPPTSLFPEDAKAKGTAFHFVMQEIPLSLTSEGEVADFLDKLRAEGGLSEADRADLSPKAVADAVRSVRELVGARVVLREKPFLLHASAREVGVADISDRVEVQGKIDLLALGGEDAVIVDYKLSKLPAEILAETYRGQLDLYALAVRKSFGVKHVSRYILVLGRNQLIKL